jgi:hypothetical protein
MEEQMPGTVQCAIRDENRCIQQAEKQLRWITIGSASKLTVNNQDNN